MTARRPRTRRRANIKPGATPLNHSSTQSSSDATQVPPLAWAVLACGIGVAALLAWYLHSAIRADASTYFSNSSDQMTLTIEERLQSFGLVLRSGAGLLSGSNLVTRADWRRYVEQLAPQLNLPGVQGIGYAELLQPQDVQAFVERVRAEGFAEFNITPAGPREVYSSIVYLEPFSGRNLNAFGYDMYSDPVRQAAMAQARDSGLPSLSGKVQLVQETDSDVQAGTLMYFPVYRGDLSPTTQQERRDSLIGWTYSPFRMQDLISSVLQDWQQQLVQNLDLYIYDGDVADNAQLLYMSRAGYPHLPTVTHDLPSRQRRTIDFNGRRWLLVYDFDPAAAGLSYLPVWLALGGGNVITVLLFGLLLSLHSTRQRAERIAVGLTADIRKREAQLQESEFRWKFALEGAGDGVWDWQLDTNEVYFTPRWKAMLGFADHEISGSLDEWKRRIHPDDVPRVMREVSDYLEGRTTNYRSEHRVLCKDGRYMWILDRGALVQRDRKGKPLRMIGTHTDIDARKQLESTLQQRQHDLQEAQRIGLMGSFSLDLASGAVVWSDQLCTMFGLPPGSPSPNFAEQGTMFTPESWERLQTAVARTRELGMPYELELETLTQDGIRGWILARGEAVRDTGLKVVGVRGIAQDITQRKLAERRIAKLTDFYAALSACHKLLATCRSDAEIFQQICDIFVSHGGMQMAWIGLIDKAGLRVVPTCAAGTGTDYLDGIEISTDPEDPHGRGATGTAARENRPVWIDNFRINPRSAPWHQRGARYGWASSAALPLLRGGKSIGALTFYSTERGSYDPEIRQLLEEMSRVISFALDKLDAEALAYQGEEVLQKVFLQTVGLATSLVELRDPYTAGHVQRVSKLAEAIGKELGYGDERVQGLRVAGLLYDIGKIMVPAEILSKPGRISNMELQLIRQHTQAGFEMLQHVEFPWPVAQVALQHHERLDGSGYPQGLKGEIILKEARIIGLADVLLAMCSHRPYRAALPLDQALAEIGQGKGTLYDAEVVEACLRLFREQRFTL